MDNRSLELKLEKLNRPVKDRLASIFSNPGEPKEVYSLLSEFMALEGKMLRPALCLLACDAVGGERDAAVPAAAAIEMFHNFTLIHDDIEDSSELRRGKPCLYIKYGLPLALNAGDGLFMMVWRETLRIGGDRREEAQRRLLSAFTKVLEGQAVELGWYRDNNWEVDEEEYRSVVRGKTGALISISCEIGAFLGGGDERICKKMGEFGMGIGVAFQIIDDVLNIVGEEKHYGKEIGGDIVEGKRTLMTINAMRMLPPAKRSRFGGIMRKGKKTRQDVHDALALLRESGAVEAALQAAENELKTALGCLDALPGTQAKKDLTQLANYITRREK